MFFMNPYSTFEPWLTDDAQRRRWPLSGSWGCPGPQSGLSRLLTPWSVSALLLVHLYKGHVLQPTVCVALVIYNLDPPTK